MRREDVTRFDYKDVDLLRQFLDDRGRLRKRKKTGLSQQEQRALTRAVKTAREMALLSYDRQAH